MYCPGCGKPLEPLKSTTAPAFTYTHCGAGWMILKKSK
jgi:hypothetical protein